jgi:hypothetical protein
MRDLWRQVKGERTDLVRLDDVAKGVKARTTPVNRFEYVPLAQIVGTSGRPKDFNRDFLPRPRVNSERWASVDAAINAGVGLPPVELYRIGDVYFVNDGHHRISVAHVNGFKEIEANGIQMSSPVWLTAADFRHDEWQAKVGGDQEEKMHLFDEVLAKEHLADIYREMAHERLVQIATVGKPGLAERLRTRMGDILIELGNLMKVRTLPGALQPKGEEGWG